MFSFHKPKIYRSINGCCICRAKSSSSRFTDSKRYEADFEKCFKTKERRSGEICNACVLLVKRWKKLPPGSNRNWHHVVDARAGPGTKSIAKIKNKHKEERRSKKHKHQKALRTPKPPQSPGGLSDDVVMGDDYYLSDDSISRDSPSPIPSDMSDEEGEVHRVREQSTRSRMKKHANPIKISPFLDLTYWKKTKVCCGIIFTGPNGAVLLDPKLLRPCKTCKPPTKTAAPMIKATPTMTPEPCQTQIEAALQLTDARLAIGPLGARTARDLDAVNAVLDLSLPGRKNAVIHQPPCLQMEV